MTSHSIRAGTSYLVLNDTAVYAAIVELLLELEGVDPEPDFWARSARGPWHIAVNEDCAQQFQAKYGEQTNIRIQGTDIAVRIKIESIEDKINKKGTSTHIDARSCPNESTSVRPCVYSHKG